MIDVILPGKFSGEEIVAQFKKAATFTVQDRNDYKWVGLDQPAGYIYTPESGLVLAKKKLIARPLYGNRRYLFAGAIEWSYGEAFIESKPLELDIDYSQIVLGVYAPVYREGHSPSETRDPGSPEFANYRPHLDRILDCFTNNLQEVSARMHGGELRP